MWLMGFLVIEKYLGHKWDEALILSGICIHICITKDKDKPWSRNLFANKCSQNSLTSIVMEAMEANTG